MMALMATLGLLAAAATSDVACSGSKARTLYEYRSVSPLLLDEPDAETAVAIKADGCVRVHFPEHDVQRGDYDLRVDPAALERTARQLDASGVSQYSAAALRARLQKKSAESVAGPTPEVVYRTVDENIIEFRFSSQSGKAAGAEPVRLSTLQSDLLLLPDDPALIGVAAAEEVFRDVAAQARERGSRARP